MTDASGPSREPRTRSGRAAASSLSGPAVAAIEDEARAPLLDLLSDARDLLDRVAVDEATHEELAQEAADLEGRIAAELE